jgi:hypothetical protein
VPLWARADSASIERNSIDFMLAVQFGISAMLFPWLMRDLRSSVFVTLLAALFIQLAAMVGGATWETTATAMLESGIWLCSLALWNTTLVRVAHQSIAVALASAIVIGGGMVQYLQLEFGGAVTPSIGVAAIRIVLSVNLICALIVASVMKRQLK